MIHREIKVHFFSDLRSIRWAKKGKTRVRVRNISFDLPIRIDNSFDTCALDFFFFCRTNTFKIATKSGYLLHDKAYSFDHERIQHQRTNYKK